MCILVVCQSNTEKCLSLWAIMSLLDHILTFTAHEGGTVEIHCPYESGYEANEKYLCRGECPRMIKDKVVESGSAARGERFSLTDNKTAHIFTVTITDLRTEDQGQYWCGVKIGLGLFDDFTKIHLEIKHVSRVSGTVEIHCPYESGYEANEKYLCRGECPRMIKDKVVESGSAARGERFSLTDNKTAHIFTVTITDLRTEDQGQYWCGVETGWRKLDVFTEIHLEIKRGKLEYAVLSRVSGVTGKHLYIPCHYKSELKNNVKIICKGSDPSLCETSAIRVSSEIKSNGRFSLSDNKSAEVFTVTFTNLTEEDSGIYWCGAAQRGQEHKNKWISVTDLNISAGKMPLTGFILC
uniref:Si:ch211-114l13.12 n=1 Tax=Cyprinus carpio TaxID=7962 RepID=A0A8C1UCF4_CYPCA